MTLERVKPYKKHCEEVIKTEKPGTLANQNWRLLAAKGMLQVLSAITSKRGQPEKSVREY